MAHTPHPAQRQEERVDDLTEIHGIGQAMEHKLNQAGVFTFTQLANMPTEKLAALFSHMPGWSVEREKELISQARRLMEKEDTTDNSPSDDNAQYLAQFSVDVLLDNQKRVRRTHVIHVQSGVSDVWAEWDNEQLSNFILKNTMIRPERIRTENVKTNPTLQSPPEDKNQTATKEEAGYLKISEVEIQTQSGAVIHWLVRADESFAVRLSLNMTESSISPGTPLRYQAEVYVKNLADGNRQNVGDNKGTIISKDLLPLTINCIALPQGSYRLEAYITLSPDMEDSNPRTRLMAMTEGKVFRVN